MKGLLSSLMLLISTSAFAGDVILDLTGNGAIVSFTQYGDHYLNVTAVDNVGSSVDAATIQKGGGNHSLTMSLTNNAGSIDADVVQDSTSDLTLSITQTCQTTTGCSISVNQTQ